MTVPKDRSLTVVSNNNGESVIWEILKLIMWEWKINEALALIRRRHNIHDGEY